LSSATVIVSAPGLAAAWGWPRTPTSGGPLSIRRAYPPDLVTSTSLGLGHLPENVDLGVIVDVEDPIDRVVDVVAFPGARLVVGNWSRGDVKTPTVFKDPPAGASGVGIERHPGQRHVSAEVVDSATIEASGHIVQDGGAFLQPHYPPGIENGTAV